MEFENACCVHHHVVVTTDSKSRWAGDAQALAHIEELKQYMHDINPET